MTLEQIVIAWLVTSVSLFIIAQLSPITGVEVDNFKIALISAAVFGLLNAFVRPILAKYSIPIMLEVFPSLLITIILNMVIFGLAAWLVEGFRLRRGILSALIGSVALGFINAFLYEVLEKILA